MEPHEDARLRLAAFRHPAARAVGSLQRAESLLAEAARAFVTLMAAAGDPGAHHLPAPAGRTRWPSGHPARDVRGWPVPVALDGGARCWLDTTGHWWLVRLDDDGGGGASAADVEPVDSPLRRADELAGFRTALDEVLAARRVAR